MIIVNTFMGASHHTLDENKCTRYCHDKGCQHYQFRIKDYPMSASAEKLYYANIRLLHQNGLGLSYAEANLLIYVILIPFLSAILLWGIIRKRNE